MPRIASLGPGLTTIVCAKQVMLEVRQEVPLKLTKQFYGGNSCGVQTQNHKDHFLRLLGFGFVEGNAVCNAQALCTYLAFHPIAVPVCRGVNTAHPVTVPSRPAAVYGMTQTQTYTSPYSHGGSTYSTASGLKYYSNTISPSLVQYPQYQVCLHCAPPLRVLCLNQQRQCRPQMPLWMQG